MKKQQQQVSIPISLFVDLIKFHCLEYDVDEHSIREALTDKLDAIAKREYYTQYKTATTPEEREKARQEYLRRAGINKDFRW